ncbi:MaoC family dehydratase [Pseudochrobactrum kiredjianiae]|uniref:MaoC family dehydratase n=1 Tax=Pseudochrobactrum kiredjianiae TaxID=386305 RepID=A0ABW3V3Q3_9HYPH|nr:MaoC family dehydratase [Pseudochrobactrum kiredjianiae]MDM7851023.1 MaoC family dehydratase [Pseudochrobactrum kiredjianiae]
MHKSRHHFTYHDFTVGESIPLGSKEVTAEEVIAFASEFDPQPFHLSEEAGKATILGGLAASGWHTCAMLMRMMADSYISNSDSQGAPGVDYVKWLKPVLAGDTLSATSTVLEKRISRSQPSLGIIRLNHKITNQHNILVGEAQGSIFMHVQNQEA